MNKGLYFETGLTKEGILEGCHIIFPPFKKFDFDFEVVNGCFCIGLQGYEHPYMHSIQYDWNRQEYVIFYDLDGIAEIYHSGDVLKHFADCDCIIHLL